MTLLSIVGAAVCDVDAAPASRRDFLLSQGVGGRLWAAIAPLAATSAMPFRQLSFWRFGV